MADSFSPFTLASIGYATDVSNDVNAAFLAAQGYVSANTSQAAAYITALGNLSFHPPTVDVNWTAFTAPSMPQLPEAPTVSGSLPSITFTDPGAPSPLSGDFTESMTISPFAGSAPEFASILVPSITFGTVPNVAVNSISVPQPGTITAPPAPSLLTVLTPAWGGISDHSGMLAPFSALPNMVLVAPQGMTYTPPSCYTEYVTGLQSTASSRLSDGGLSAMVEAAMWDRARSREANNASNDEIEATRVGEASGFFIPSGAMAFHIIQARQQYNDKVAALSRDVVIKQAELSQANINKALEEGIKLQQVKTQYDIETQKLIFEAAKTVATLAVEKYNADVRAYAALTESYKAFAEVYKAVIQGELAKVEVYKAQWQGAAATADINKSIAGVYESQVKGTLAQVEVYKAQVEGARAQMEVERARIEAVKTQIEAFTAGVNAQVAQVQGVKAQVEVQTARAQTYKTEVDAYSAMVDAQAKVAQVKATYAGIQLEAKKTEYEGYKAKLEAQKTQISAQTAQSSLIVDAYKATSSIAVAQAEVATKNFEAEIKQYEAQTSVTLQAAKINTDAYLATRQALLEASKVGAQVYAQLVASAYGSMHASVGLSGSSAFNNSASNSSQMSWSNLYNNAVSKSYNTSVQRSNSYSEQIQANGGAVATSPPPDTLNL